VLAQSLGAPFALALAHRHPDRVDELGLVGPIGPLDVEGAREWMDRPRMLLSRPVAHTAGARRDLRVDPVAGRPGRRRQPSASPGSARNATGW
jgi:pimeloyl-ACP methyl ester carboxylesterase